MQTLNQHLGNRVLWFVHSMVMHSKSTHFHDVITFRNLLTTVLEKIIGDLSLLVKITGQQQIENSWVVVLVKHLKHIHKQFLVAAILIKSLILYQLIHTKHLLTLDSFQDQWKLDPDQISLDIILDLQLEQMVWSITQRQHQYSLCLV